MSPDSASQARAPGFTLVSRVDCHLCEVMLDELRRFLGANAVSVSIVDVDSDAELRHRYGHKVPVLLHDGELICCSRFDPAEVTRLTRSALRGS